jgi:hypothetical protein
LRNQRVFLGGFVVERRLTWARSTRNSHRQVIERESWNRPLVPDSYSPARTCRFPRYPKELGGSDGSCNSSTRVRQATETQIRIMLSSNMPFEPRETTGGEAKVHLKQRRAASETPRICPVYSGSRCIINLSRHPSFKRKLRQKSLTAREIHDTISNRQERMEQALVCEDRAVL